MSAECSKNGIKEVVNLVNSEELTPGQAAELLQVSLYHETDQYEEDFEKTAIIQELLEVASYSVAVEEDC